MQILLNGAWRELAAGASAQRGGGTPDGAAGPVTLEAMLQVFGYRGATVATAVNGEFVPAGARHALHLREGDRVEVLAPMQGG
jgi:sulfur carrier protein